MIKVHDVPVNLGSVPPGLGTVETNIDTALNQSWGPLEPHRDLTLTWANLGGFTEQKAQWALGLMEYYRLSGRWDVTRVSMTTTAWVVRFSRVVAGG